MKYDLSICAPIAIAALLLLAIDAEGRPNNYINIDNNGVVAEIDQGGDTYVHNGNVIYTDMATQAELDAAVKRLDAEDMRLHGGEVVGDDLILTVGDFAKSRGRNEVYTKEVTIDVSSLRGNDGADGINGVDGLQGNDGRDGIDGVDGVDGTDGRDGVDGLNGTNGLDGINGINGTDGVDGVDGADGADGRDGTNGLNGTDGRDGVDGVDGADGKDGLDGVDGKDGRDGRNGLDVPRSVQLDLRAGIAGALASSHAIRSNDGLRVGVGLYRDQAAVAIGGRKDDKTFTFSIDSRKKVAVGFGMDL